jgi:hypothetical protein
VGSPGAPVRQASALAAITQHLTSMREILGALLVGSMAAGTADAASDIDLIVCAHPGRFGQAWRLRNDLHATGALICWDDGHESNPEIGVHRWVTPDVVLVEALFATPGSGVRLAEPWTVIAGDPSVAKLFPARPPIDRAEFDPAGAHPVDRAFSELKAALRYHARQQPIPPTTQRPDVP